MFRKRKELQSLVDASRTNLEKAERKVEDRNVLIAHMEKQANALYEENKDLRYETEKQKELINRIERLVISNTYNNEKIFFDKIKELVRDYQSKN